MAEPRKNCKIIYFLLFWYQIQYNLTKKIYGQIPTISFKKFMWLNPFFDQIIFGQNLTIEIQQLVIEIQNVKHLKDER